MKKTKLIPFDLNSARRGAKVVDAHGSLKNIVILDAVDNDPFKIWISYFYKGNWYSTRIDKLNLRLEIEVKTEKFWIAIGKYPVAYGRFVTSKAAVSKEELKELGFDESKYTFHEIEREI